MIFWIGFHLLIIVMLFIDLRFSPKSGSKTQSALICSLLWVLTALGFNGCIWGFMGGGAALTFFTAYLVEKSLSVDNLFLFYSVFTALAIPATKQHRILVFGVLGALVFRLIFIVLGISLVEKFHFIDLLFGLFLCVSAFFVYRKESEVDLKKAWLFNKLQKWLHVQEDHEGVFFIKKQGKWSCTKYFVALLLIESFDILFAIDSVPAVIAVTRDPFLAYTSNAFAVLGLRSLHFLLACYVSAFPGLKKGIAWILCFIGGKLLLSPLYTIPNIVCLIFIAGVLMICCLRLRK